MWLETPRTPLFPSTISAPTPASSANVTQAARQARTSMLVMKFISFRIGGRVRRPFRCGRQAAGLSPLQSAPASASGRTLALALTAASALIDRQNRRHGVEKFARGGGFIENAGGELELGPASALLL